MIRSNVNPLTFPQLFTAGRSVLTLHNPKSGNHITVKSRQWKKRNAEGKLVKLPKFTIEVSLLGDKEQGMVLGGYFFQDENNWKLAPLVDPKSQLAKVMEFLKGAFEDPALLRSKGVALLHEGKCCRCALPLTNPESIQRGLGDDCHSLIFGDKEARQKQEKLGLT